MAQTHEVDLTGDVVVKRYTSWHRGEPDREWTVLTTLHRHRPGLAPEPYAADLTGDPPSVTMSRVPGRPLGGALTGAHLDALEASLRSLWSVPPDGLPRRRWYPTEAWAVGADWYADTIRPGGVVGTAIDAAVDFLSGPAMSADNGQSVLGHSDMNLANFVWDGVRLRLVDFEDAGRSDPAYELATLVEHLSARDTDWTGFLDRFDVDPVRLRTGRCLSAALWLHMLLPGGPAADRNPPGTADVQAERLLRLLA